MASRWRAEPEQFIRETDGQIIGFRRRVVFGKIEDGRPGTASLEQVAVRMFETGSDASATFIFVGREYSAAVPGPDELRERIEYDPEREQWRWSDSDDFEVRRIVMHASHGDCDRARIEWRPQSNRVPSVDHLLDELESSTLHRTNSESAGRVSVTAPGWSDLVDDGMQHVVLQSVDELGRRKALRVYSGPRLTLARKSAYGPHGFRSVEAIDAVSHDGRGAVDGLVDEIRTREVDEQGRLVGTTTRIVAFDEATPVGRVAAELRSVRFDADDAGPVVEPTSRIVRRQEVEAYHGDRIAELRRTEVRGEHGFVYDDRGRLVGETFDGQIEGSTPFSNEYDGQAERRVEHAYDAAGRRTRSTVFEDGAMIRQTRFEYDTSGRLVTEHVLNRFGRTEREWTHRYSSDGLRLESLLESRNFGGMPGRRSYVYEGGTLVETRTQNSVYGTSVRRFRYDDAGHLVEEVARGQPNMPHTLTTYHEYDESGRRLRTRRGAVVFDYEYRGERLDRIVSRLTTTIRFDDDCAD
jgi:YD repeat-containing protein